MMFLWFFPESLSLTTVGVVHLPGEGVSFRGGAGIARVPVVHALVLTTTTDGAGGRVIHVPSVPQLTHCQNKNKKHIEFTNT